MSTPLRYQESSLVVKCYRWCRFKPIGYVIGCLKIAEWACRGMRPITLGPWDDGFTHTLSRLETMSSIWTIQMSRTEIKMRWWYSLEESVANIQRAI